MKERERAGELKDREIEKTTRDEQWEKGECTQR
jgi:hypothetical protein